MNDAASETRVLIADDHPATRDGLAALLEREPGFKVVAQAQDGIEAVSLFRIHRPQLTLLDLRMPRMDGLRAIAAIRQEFGDALIVVLTSYEGDSRVARALSLGVRSYILKTSHPRDVMSALRRVLSGEVVVDSRLAKTVDVRQEHLTPLEISVMKLIAQGRPMRDIALSLNVSEQILKAQLQSILAKLGANNPAHAVTIAWQRGFLDF
ncbi:MAG TPA: response regulator transcription factor [Steroidobacteraceae bacterium]|nr:response regulator transcription factor [Steroidobacteraceae bacterium]